MLTRFFTTKELIILVGIGAAVCIGGIAVLVARTTTPAHVVVTENAPAGGKKPDAQSAPAPAPQEVAPAPAPEPATPPPPTKVVVSVMGEVVAPGVYTLPDSARVDDLIDAAGGPTETADFSDINRAAPLIDGSTLTLPARMTEPAAHDRVRIRRPAPPPPANPPQYTISGWRPPVEGTASGSTPSASHSGSKPAATGLIDLNRATAEQLETLPGIGPKYADAIVSYRQHHPFASVDDLQNVRGIGAKRLEDLRPLVTVSP